MRHAQITFATYPLPTGNSEEPGSDGLLPTSNVTRGTKAYPSPNRPSPATVFPAQTLSVRYQRASKKTTGRKGRTSVSCPGVRYSHRDSHRTCGRLGEPSLPFSTPSQAIRGHRCAFSHRPSEPFPITLGQRGGSRTNRPQTKHPEIFERMRRPFAPGAAQFLETGDATPSSRGSKPRRGRRGSSSCTMVISA